LPPQRQRELGYSNFIALVLQFDEEAGQTRDYCVAKNATLRAARPDPSLRKERLFGMTIKISRRSLPGVKLTMYNKSTQTT
jgi:hypothetical protein